MFPDFLCIGAQKAGTTWLHENLSHQPGIWLPPVKELHFLDHKPAGLHTRLFSGRSHHRSTRRHFYQTAKEVAAGRVSLSDLGGAWHLAFGSRTYDWYEAIFPSAPGLVCGEICPGYARLGLEQIRRIHERNPRLRIVYLLRDPVDRMWSALAMHFRKGGNIADVPEAEILRRFASPGTRAHAGYARNLDAWLSVFPDSQVFIGYFEEIVKGPSALLGRLLPFLSVSEPLRSIDPGIRVNAGRGERIPPAVERALATALIAEAEYLHRRYCNAHTRRWLEHAERASGAVRTAGIAV